MQKKLGTQVKYYIITPTYNRPQELIKSVQSVLDQKERKEISRNSFDFEIIIINDSPEHDYSAFKQTIDTNLTKIKYFKNEKNMGVNFSRNFALDYIEKNSIQKNNRLAGSAAFGGAVEINLEYIIFLDDDDWLAPDALQNITDIINREVNRKTNKSTANNIASINWLITNRSLPDNTSMSYIRKENINNFNIEFLLLRKSFGDVTHTIQKSLALTSRFSKKVKQGEEWIYFSNLNSSTIYKNINTTFSNGYGNDGLNTYMSTQDKKLKIKNLYNLFLEKLKSSSTINSKAIIATYLFLRVLKTCLQILKFNI